MTNRATPTATLASDRLGQDVGAWIVDRRSDGKTWQEVLVDLHSATGLAISTVTLRSWAERAA